MVYIVMQPGLQESWVKAMASDSPRPGLDEQPAEVILTYKYISS